MNKLVVLCSIIAMVSARPGLWGSGLGPIASVYSSGPLVSSVGVSPLVSSIGVSPIVSGLGVSPLVSGLGVSGWGASPLVSSAVISASEPALAPGVPAIALKANGQNVDTLDVVVAKNNHLVAKGLALHGIQKRSAITPLALSNGIVTSPLGLVPTTLGINSGLGLVSPLGLNSGLIGARSIVSPIGSVW